MASRMRCSTAPVWRSKRARTRSTAISAAFSPAAWPPMPSTTRKIPRSASMCQASSLFLRTRPISLAPAYLRPVLTMFAAAAIQKDHAREADARLGRHRRLDVAVPLLAIDELHAGRSLLAIDGGAEAAQVFQEELAGVGVAAKSKVFAGDIGKRVELEIGPVIAAATAD